MLQGAVTMTDERYLDFLEWLQPLVGDWSLDGGQYRVRRRQNGWLQVFELRSPRRPLEDVLTHGSFEQPPPGPLGPRPVVLSYPLMARWLAPEQVERLQHGVHVSRGRDEILRAVEEAMSDSEPAAIRAFWRDEWRLGIQEDNSVPEEDMPLMRRLLEQFESGRSPER
jgi:hypothetical protein